MAANKKNMRIVTKPAWCKGCSICVTFCPKQCLELDTRDKIVFARPDDCIKCGQCEMRCPDFAIFLADEDRIRESEQSE